MLTRIVARATTCEIAPGDERVDGTMLRIRNRVFTDVVEAEDPRVAGANQPALNIDLDPQTGEGTLEGRFLLKPATGDGSWQGELCGEIRQGLVRAWGTARGTGSLAGSVLRVDFRQVEQPSFPAPCENPKAFFEMDGWILAED